MTVEVYNQLDYDCKIIALKEAVCIAERQQEDFTIFLYQLNNFYIEVFQHKMHWCYCSIRCFDEWEKLDPYLEDINVDLS